MDEDNTIAEFREKFEDGFLATNGKGDFFNDLDCVGEKSKEPKKGTQERGKELYVRVYRPAVLTINRTEESRVHGGTYPKVCLMLLT